MIVSFEGIIAEHALHLEFPAMNNDAEYEALIARLEAVKDLRVLNLRVYSDSQLIVGHVRATLRPGKI